jgi:hypothetical protein
VPLPLRLAEQIEQRRARALRRVARHAERLRDAIRRLESDAAHLVGEAIGIGLHQPDRGVAVLHEQARHLARRHAVAHQERRGLADRAPLVPRLGDLLGLLAADPFDLAHARGIGVEHFVRLVAEMLDDALRERRADAAELAREIRDHPGPGAGPHLFVPLGHELATESRVVLVLAAQLQPRAGRETIEMAGHGDRQRKPEHVDAKNRISVLLVLEEHVADLAAQLDLRPDLRIHSAPPRGIRSADP